MASLRASVLRRRQSAGQSCHEQRSAVTSRTDQVRDMALERDDSYLGMMLLTCVCEDMMLMLDQEVDLLLRKKAEHGQGKRLVLSM
uniref:Uncharacterized protein n=1 Tax=Plectus sambesii TaxID=2011161 RepID=A0A914VD91_9BILA